MIFSVLALGQFAGVAHVWTTRAHRCHTFNVESRSRHKARRHASPANVAFAGMSQRRSLRESERERWGTRAGGLSSG
jgi:hypothetical protein